MGRRVRNGARTRAGSRRRFRAARLAASALALAAGLAVAPVPVAAPAVADEGLAESTHGRYVLDADEDRVVATVTTTVRNTRAPSGGYVYYYDRYGIPVPAGAQDVRAVSGGVDLPVSVRTTEDPGTATAAVTFAALAFLTASFTRTPDAAHYTTMPGFAVLFGGLMWMLSTPADEVTVPMLALPGNAVTQLLRYGWTGEGAVGMNVVWPLVASVAVAIASCVVAARLFRWEPRG